MAFMLAPMALERPAELALQDDTGAVTWRDLNLRVNQLIRVFQAAGLKAGDRLALFAGNTRHYFEVMVAAHHVGLRYVPVNWHFTAEELAYVLQDCAASALVTDARFAGIAQQALRLVPDCARQLRVCLDAAAASVAPGFEPLDALLATQPEPSEPLGQSAGGPMFYTSGTTGRPKGVLRKAAGASTGIETVRTFALGMTEMVGLPVQGVTLLAGPIYHSAQWSFCFAAFLLGSRVVMAHKFDAEQTLELIDLHQVTNVHLVPTQFLRLLRLPAEVRARFRGRSLQKVWHGAAPCAPEVKRDMIAWWGPCIHEYYGSTEGAIVTGITSAEWLQRPGSVGRQLGKVEFHILREDGSPAPATESGTIYMRNQNAIELEYHNDPAKTAAAHQGGSLFTTGDVGWVDAEGFLYLTDRKIDMIISGGVNIYPAEIESALCTHVAVHDVAVFGVPNAEFGEEVKALVELTPGHAASEDLTLQLLAHCRQTLAGYKVPRSIEFRTTLPRTETGKLQKRLLRDAYWVGTGRKI